MNDFLLLDLHNSRETLADQQEFHALPARDSNLVFLQDSLFGRRFLVDTGASITVFPQTAPTPSDLLSQT